MFIAIKTDDGRIKGKISFYCKALKVSRQAFNNYLKTKAAQWKHDVVNITLHFFLKDVRPMLPLVMKHNTAVA